MPPTATDAQVQTRARLHPVRWGLRKLGVYVVAAPAARSAMLRSGAPIRLLLRDHGIHISPVHRTGMRSLTWPDRARRTGKYLKIWSTDWLNERARFPGLVVGGVVLALVPVLGISFTGALALEWGIGKIPMLWSVVQAIRIRQFRRWSRPQSYQDPGRVTVEQPAELKDEWREMGWQRALASAARRPGLPGYAARFFDDWLNERWRVPGFVIETVLMGSTLLGGLPTAAVFILDWVMDRGPTINSICLAVANGSLKRLNRPGSFQHARALHELTVTREREESRSEQSPSQHRVPWAGRDRAVPSLGVPPPPRQGAPERELGA